MADSLGLARTDIATMTAANRDTVPACPSHPLGCEPLVAVGGFAAVGIAAADAVAVLSISYCYIN